MEIGDYLEDISKLTKEEIEERSIPCPLDENGHVQLTPEYWDEIDGIRYLKKPLKVDNLEWCLYIVDCDSIISKIFDPDILYVFAFSTNSESTEKMGICYDEDSLWESGYSYISGFTREEANANAIDEFEIVC